MISYLLIFSLLDFSSPLRTVRSYRGTRFSFDTSIPSRIMANSLARNSTVRAPSRGRGSLNLPSSKRLYHNTKPSRSQYRIFNRSPDRTTFSIPIELRRYRISLASTPREASARVWTEPTLWKRSTLRGSSQGAMPRVTRLDVRCLVVLGDVARTAPTRSGIVERASDHFAGSLT